MKKLLIGFALVLFSLAPATRGQTSVPTMTVDAVTVSEPGELSVTGIAQGDSVPSTRMATFPYGSDATRAAALDRCHRMLLLALSKPGQYVASVGPGICTVALIKP
jgi:hypothetical protein